MPEHATLAPPICRLAGEVLSIGRRVTQKGVFTKTIAIPTVFHLSWVENTFVFPNHPLLLPRDWLASFRAAVI